MFIKLSFLAILPIYTTGIGFSFLWKSLTPFAISLVFGTCWFIIFLVFSDYLFSDRRPVLNKSEWTYFPLISKLSISPNTAIYRFQLPRPDDVLALPIGQHISVGVNVDGREISRNYTPISSDDDKGHFDLLVKSYPMGNASKVIGNMRIGEEIKVKGPRGNFHYKGSNFVRAFGMIAGGTGIAPMLQIIKAILKNSLDYTDIHLLYANVNFEDILLKEELDRLASKHPNFHVYYVLNNPPPKWTGGVGFISKEMIQDRCPAPSSDIKILICGPPPMMKMMEQYTNELGYEKPKVVSQLHDMVFKF